jgi:hypothetical protein
MNRWNYLSENTSTSSGGEYVVNNVTYLEGAKLDSKLDVKIIDNLYRANTGGVSKIN